MIELEILSTDREAEEVVIYTESPDTHRLLTKLNPRFATYEKAGHIFAWQHRIGTSQDAEKSAEKCRQANTGKRKPARH